MKASFLTFKIYYCSYFLIPNSIFWSYNFSFWILWYILFSNSLIMVCASSIVILLEIYRLICMSEYFMSFIYFLSVWRVYLSLSQSFIKLSLEIYFEKVSLKLSLFFLNSSWKVVFFISYWKPVLKELVFKKLRMSTYARLCLVFFAFWEFKLLTACSMCYQWSLRVLSKSSLRFYYLWSIMASHRVLTSSIMTTSSPLGFSNYVSLRQISSKGSWLRVLLTC